MPAAVGRYLLQQAYLIFSIFIQKIILSTVNGLDVSFNAFPLAYRIFSQWHSRSGLHLNEKGITGSSATSDSMRLTNLSKPWKVFRCCCYSLYIYSNIWSADSAPKRVPLIVLFILASYNSYTPSPTAPRIDCVLLRTTCLYVLAPTYSSLHFFWGLVTASSYILFDSLNLFPLNEWSLRFICLSGS